MIKTWGSLLCEMRTYNLRQQSSATHVLVQQSAFHLDDLDGFLERNAIHRCLLPVGHYEASLSLKFVELTNGTFKISELHVPPCPSEDVFRRHISGTFTFRDGLWRGRNRQSGECHAEELSSDAGAALRNKSSLPSNGVHLLELCLEFGLGRIT